MSQSFVTRTDGGRRTLNVWVLGSAYGVGFLSNVWCPATISTTGDALVRGSLGLALGTLSNVAAEFWPHVRRKLFHR